MTVFIKCLQEVRLCHVSSAFTIRWNPTFFTMAHVRISLKLKHPNAYLIILTMYEPRVRDCLKSRGILLPLLYPVHIVQSGHTVTVSFTSFLLPSSELMGDPKCYHIIDQHSVTGTSSNCSSCFFSVLFTAATRMPIQMSCPNTSLWITYTKLKGKKRKHVNWIMNRFLS